MANIHQNFHLRGKNPEIGSKYRFSSAPFYALAYLFLYFQVRVTPSVSNGNL